MGWIRDLKQNWDALIGRMEDDDPELEEDDAASLSDALPSLGGYKKLSERTPRCEPHELPAGAAKAMRGIAVFTPCEYEDCQTIADKLKSGSVVLVDYGEMDWAPAHQVFGFMSGCAYALDCTMKKVSRNVILYVPRRTELLYLNMYGTENSTAVPKGFIIKK